jgi:hypothetical protein
MVAERPVGGSTVYRLALCGHKAAEVSGVCLLLMVQGHLLAITAAHLAVAAKTGGLAILPALVITFTRHARRMAANRWTSALFIGLCGFVADAVVHGSHYPGAYTEAALTGVGTTAASILVSYTPIGKRIDRLAEGLGTR